MTRDPSSPLALLLVTPRDAVAGFFRQLPHVRTIVGEADDETLAAVDAVAVDVAVEPERATALCRELAAARPNLPVIAVLCCPQAVNSWQVQRLIGDGVASILDLQASADEAVRTLEAAARGRFVLHVHLRAGQRRFLRRVLSGDDPRTETKLRVLELVARGLSDRAIGAELHISPHTVKHHVEDLRGDLGARNRTELAAWAGRHGFYEPEGDDLVPVRLARPDEL
jgi:NarL family two-component system response regulator LiaR